MLGILLQWQIVLDSPWYHKEKENERLRQLVGTEARDTERLAPDQEPATSARYPRRAPNFSPPVESGITGSIQSHTQEGLLPLSSTPSQDGSAEQPYRPGDIAHELGMISVSAGVSKYIGPSSGFSIARLVFARADQASGDRLRASALEDTEGDLGSRSFLMLKPAPLPASEQEALELSQIFFEHVHPRYPFLHEPTHMRRIAEVYRNPQAPIDLRFQVTMVLAISAIIMSRRLRKPFNGEGMCATAMEYADQVDFQNSAEGVQCLLLIYLFTLHSPVLGFNPWYLNYQCLAAIVDLGFHHDIVSTQSVDRYGGEMRRRIFWVAYSVDRILASTLGRPIGFGDEACDLKVKPMELLLGELHADAASQMPDLLDDQQLELLRTNGQFPEPSPNIDMSSSSCSLVHFKLALFNSEIIYVLHSKAAAPEYTYPQVPDIDTWKSGLYTRLLSVHEEFSDLQSEHKYLWLLCEIRYHEVVMLLFRPTPRLRHPGQASLYQCFTSAEATINLWKNLADSNRISYSWSSVHSICLSAITVLYCIWMVRDLAVSTEISDLTQTMMTAISLLSASGEYWSDASRCRDSLNNLAAATIKWLVGVRANTMATAQPQDPVARPEPPSYTELGNSMPQCNETAAQILPGNMPDRGLQWDPDFPWIDTYINSEDLTTLFRTSNFEDCDLTSTVEGMFSEFPPILNLCHENVCRM
ncbi:unnamed protein product [Clonostachys byssicola]|uniref:Xylanolytic transcriptional activator regulatory domain-containing protein n=1 Tax=Clonostachys byssicola TaxID=160290 RepID=A0A9N9Y049_9HYPO|nr:unnamed protein product [Clonostachys byssicola]